MFLRWPNQARGDVIMATLRIPFAVVSGFLFSLAVFLGLVQLIGAPLDVGEPVAVRDINFTPQIKTTPTENKREPKVERKPPPVTVLVGDFGGTDRGGVTVATFDPPAIDVDVRGRRGLVVGSDRDVLPLVRINPDYPPRAITSNIEGWVQVRFNVTAAGSVRGAVVVASEPGTIFDDAALKAIARWRYNPRVDGGVAVERVGLQTVFRFELEN